MSSHPSTKPQPILLIHGGIILLGPDGQIGIAHNTPRMAWGIATATGHQQGITRNP